MRLIAERNNMFLGNLPNYLTILRISLIPIFMFFYYMQGVWVFWVTSGIFIFACLTDWLDGYLARKLHQESRFGAFLDPVADKLIVVVALILMVQSYGTIVFSIPALIIICREIIISALRELMAQHGRSAKIAVAYVGKLKTFMQMTAIAILLTQPHIIDFNNYITIAGFIFLYTSVVLTIWSMCLYLHASWGVLNNVE